MSVWIQFHSLCHTLTEIEILYVLIGQKVVKFKYPKILESAMKVSTICTFLIEYTFPRFDKIPKFPQK